MSAVVDGHILCSKTLLIMECLYNLKFPIQRMSIKMLIVMEAPGKQPKKWSQIALPSKCSGIQVEEVPMTN